ncbi:MAG: MFS transporter [Planctomycetia bacterium]|nr:MFS transporter [Planctomycetia bacterium]
MKDQTDVSENEERFSPWRIAIKLFSIPSVVLLTCGFVAIVFVNNAYLVWAPGLLTDKFSLSLTAAGGNSMFYHHLGALAFVLIGGAVSDGIARRIPTFRIHLQWTSMLLGAPFIYMFGAGTTLGTVLAMSFVFGVFRGLYESNTHAAIFEAVPARYRASLVGLMIMVAFLIGSTAPLLLGWLCDLYGKAEGLTIGFELLSIVWIFGGLAVLFAACFTYRRDIKKRMDRE